MTTPGSASYNPAYLKPAVYGPGRKSHTCQNLLVEPGLDVGHLDAGLDGFLVVLLDRNPAVPERPRSQAGPARRDSDLPGR